MSHEQKSLCNSTRCLTALLARLLRGIPLNLNPVIDRCHYHNYPLAVNGNHRQLLIFDKVQIPMALWGSRGEANNAAMFPPGDGELSKAHEAN
jgi:hypothetical protein